MNHKTRHYIEFEGWQIRQLEQLSKTRPKLVEKALNLIWEAFPGLYEELAENARAQQAIEPAPDADESTIVVDHAKGVARLRDSHIAVWEIMRSFSRCGSIEALEEVFPFIPRSDLMAALEYAEKNPTEIERQIAGYELHASRKKSEYPFME